MPIVFFVIGITFGLGTGATSVIARFIGSGDKRQADNAAEHSILIGLGIGLLIVIGALAFKYQILAHLGASEEVLVLAADYFEVTVPGFIFWILNVGFRSVMAGEGDTRTPMTFQGVGVILKRHLSQAQLSRLRALGPNRPGYPPHRHSGIGGPFSSWPWAACVSTASSPRSGVRQSPALGLEAGWTPSISCPPSPSPPAR